jgi:endonuclease/exonuclease/phosphatase (EEP) superfamily protein YafD
MRAARGLLIGTAAIYATAVGVLGVLWTIEPARTWWLALSNIFALYLFAPLLLIAPAALLSRSKWLRGAAALSIVVFLALFGARLIPPASRPAVGMKLRVMTLNQLDSNDRLDDLIRMIRAQDADVVAIQELSEPVAAAIRGRLSAEYPYQFLAAGNEDYGLGLLSRYPLRSAVRTEQFPGQRALVDIGGEQIALINVHLPGPQIETRRLRQFRPVKVVLDYDTSERAHAVQGLLRAISEAEGPLIVLGDFNTSDREPPYDELAARLHDAYRETAWGFGFTFPNDNHLVRLTVPFPVVRIDYVWSNGGVLPAAARVICESGGSDHCAVAADLRIEDTRRTLNAER